MPKSNGAVPASRVITDLLPLTADLTMEVVAKGIKALNHEGHEGHKGKEKLFFVRFVVPSFSGPFATLSMSGVTGISVFVRRSGDPGHP